MSRDDYTGKDPLASVIGPQRAQRKITSRFVLRIHTYEEGLQQRLGIHIPYIHVGADPRTLRRGPCRDAWLSHKMSSLSLHAVLLFRTHFAS